MEKRLSTSQIDRLGQKLRQQVFGEAELTLLDEYRRTLGVSYDSVVGSVQKILGLPVSGRPAKSTTSIVEKLNRESIRLSQMQDIAGCRVIVGDLAEQDRAVGAIAAAFTGCTVVDRRLKPSHGYRAVHLIVRADGSPIEVQVRTSLQHLWAEMCEKCADVIDPALKYGGGPTSVREVLDTASRQVADIEELEVALARAGTGAEAIVEQSHKMRHDFMDILQSIIENVNETGLEAFE